MMHMYMYKYFPKGTTKLHCIAQINSRKPDKHKKNTNNLDKRIFISAAISFKKVTELGTVCDVLSSET